jgi:hypothetical protein
MMRRYITNALYTISGLVFMLFTVSCNQDGVGIFYNVATEVKLNSSKISELPVQQVTELGSKVYVRTGGTLWEGNRDGGSWNKIASGNADSIAQDGTDVYGLFYRDSLKGSSVKRYTGSGWTSPIKEFGNDGTMIGATDGSDYAAYFVYGKSSTENSIDVSNEVVGGAGDFSSFADANISNELLVDAVKLITATPVYYFAISDENLYRSGDGVRTIDTGASFSGLPTSGDYTALAVGAIESQGANYLFLGTSKGEVYYSSDGSGFTKLDDAGDEITSMDVVDLSGTPGQGDYLIIGTDDGYEEADLSGSPSSWTISGPSLNTSDADGSSEFAAAYPDLAYTYVFDVLASSEQGHFYIATGLGLWKRKTDGSFGKL